VWVLLQPEGVEITSRSADRSSDQLSKGYRNPTVALPTQHPHIRKERVCGGHPADRIIDFNLHCWGFEKKEIE
jgi:hypothetical protein